MQNLDQKDNIFVLQNTIEQSIKGKSSLSFKFVDLEKALDIVHWESISRLYGLRLMIINIIRISV